MEDLSAVTRRQEFPFAIEVPAYVRDHHSRGAVLFPAVEIMDAMASAVATSGKDIPVNVISRARFDRFIQLDASMNVIEALCSLEQGDDGTLAATLMTRAVLKSGISRKVEHATMVFGRSETPAALPLDLACSLQGAVFEVSSEDLYRDLVPFGPAFRNLQGALYLSEEGALGSVTGGDVSRAWTLGSPFALDAAFHAACAWSQRFTGIVAFPVGFSSRVVHSPVRPGERLLCRIVPVKTAEEPLVFNLHLFRHSGEPCETVTGLLMKDVSGGTNRPPDWIGRGAGDGQLEALARSCRRFSVIERKAVAPFAHRSLSPLESQRHEGMGPRRSEGFIAARLCCKRMSRALSGGDDLTPPERITTIDQEMIRPRCPSTDGTREFPCSVSHDSRFAFAASAPGAIGVDVERLADRVLKGQRFYMNQAEAGLAKGSSLGSVSASLRVWSVKECVAKAFDLKLYDAWRRSEVTRIGEQSSEVVIDGIAREAVHDTVDDHLFTVLIIE
ncbi:MAG TPA: polyketide synthase dehydratase domain-containing protein [Spirochaetota bacterium]|nr:polyketide synthase dehydratase domain-containing protein [Spirochaetota bacterium]HPI87713.1 polyketide synthase dehydratase domain-containing protein [Spirochaetota bacterium]HPR48162.1 polyketide synthase dehydratase domain-containing protein [Spirochaetota bacterium]